MEIIPALPLRRFVKIKRKASGSVDEILAAKGEIKRCKYVGSSASGSISALKELIKEKTPTLACPEDLDIVDYEVFVNEISPEKQEQVPKKHEVVSCNGVPLIPAPPDGTNDDEDEDGKYIYDVYWYDGEASDALVQETVDEEYREEQYSSNDEENPANEYPDEEDFRDHCYSREFEDDYDLNDPETRDMIREFEKNCLGTSSDENDCDEYSDDEER